jgi:hypothetical protein
MAEFGKKGWTMMYGIKTSNNIPFDLRVIDFNSGRGPSYCQTCQQDGMFEGVFYGLCGNCSEKSGQCSCVYCRVAKKDGHKRIERRSNFCKLIKDIKMVVTDLQHDYPTDEFGIVKEFIESGIDIIDIHTKHQYEQIRIESLLPVELTILSIGELTFQWNPSIAISDSVIIAAIKASKRLGTYKWLKEFWGEEIMKKEIMKNDDDYWHSDECDLKEVNIDFRNIAFCCPFNLIYGHKEQIQMLKIGPTERKECDECGNVIQCGYICSDCEDIERCDIKQCKECNSRVYCEDINEKGYCLECQNPEYDPVWPKGD